MCQDHGVGSVICLGVDFKSESVQAILQKKWLDRILVYRATSQAIGWLDALWMNRPKGIPTVRCCIDHHEPWLSLLQYQPWIRSRFIFHRPDYCLHQFHIPSDMVWSVVLNSPFTFMGQHLITMARSNLGDNWMDRFQDRYRFASASFQCHCSKPEGHLVVFPQGNCSKASVAIQHKWSNRSTRDSNLSETFKQGKKSQRPEKREPWPAAYIQCPHGHFWCKGRVDVIESRNRQNAICLLYSSLWIARLDILLPYRDCLQPFRLRISSFERCNFIT
jgi:hypothetical protein